MRLQDSCWTWLLKTSRTEMARKTKAEAYQTRLRIIEAARKVFHECGISRSTLGQVAQAAGLTRGAVYWHFDNKAALFFSMRDQASEELKHARSILLSSEFPNPLDALERSLLLFFQVIENNPSVRQTFEIMSLRCEYVDEFTNVLAEVSQPCVDFLISLKKIYAKAGTLNLLRTGLEPDALAYDTLSFTTGLFRNLLAGMEDEDFRLRVPAMITNHVSLRRREGDTRR